MRAHGQTGRDESRFPSEKRSPIDDPELVVDSVWNLPPLWRILRAVMPEPTAPKDPSAGSPKRVPVLLRRAWYGLNQAFRQRVAHLGITPDHFSILRWLSEGDPRGLTQRELTDLMASDPNTITSTLVRMENSGLIAREPHERDRRAHRVKLQAGGKKTFEKARKIAIQLQDEVLEALPEARRSVFLEELEIIADSCATAAEKSAKRRRTTAKEP
jgi:DNA-binding MarR family transcriptional regulator